MLDSWVDFNCCVYSYYFVLRLEIVLFDIGLRYILLCL